MEFIKVKFSDFLKERKGRYKPNDPFIKGLKRIDKIDFSGNIFLSEKPSKTDMILIKKGDLVISGINVEKGAMNIYNGEDESVLATIHYSSYILEEKKMDLEYLKHFLKSQNFKNALKEQVPGGIKTEIKPKHLLPLEILIPKTLEDQKKLVKRLDKLNEIIDANSTELSHQLEIITDLRQSFLREAMQGKLVSNETKDGGTGADLLEEIKTGKNSAQLGASLRSSASQFKVPQSTAKRQRTAKKYPPIDPDEIPFDIPENWVWCRLGEIIQYADNLNIQNVFSAETLINYVDIDAIDNQKHKIKEPKRKKVNELSSRARRVLKIDYIIYSTVRPYLKNIAIIKEDLENFIGSTGFVVFKTIEVKKEYIFYFLLNPDLNKDYEAKMIGFNSPSITNSMFEETFIPLPPIEIQNRIVEKLDELMAYCAELEASVRESMEVNELLLQQVLREALEKTGK